MTERISGLSDIEILTQRKKSVEYLGKYMESLNHSEDRERIRVRIKSLFKANRLDLLEDYKKEMIEMGSSLGEKFYDKAINNTKKELINLLIQSYYGT